MTDFLSDEIKIDFVALFKYLLRRLWIIILAGVVVGGIFYLIENGTRPLYRANARLYITNTQAASATSITVGDISLGKELLSTYQVILNTRLTIEEIIQEMGVDYSYNTVRGFISSSSIDNTEIMEITVTHENPEFACDLANKVVEVLPKKITYVINGSSTKTVDYAIVPTKPVGNGVLKKAILIGLAVAALAAVAFGVPFIFNDRLQGQEYLSNAYGNEYRLLSVVPDNGSHSKSKKYGSYGKHYGYYASPKVNT